MVGLPVFLDTGAPLGLFNPEKGHTFDTDALIQELTSGEPLHPTNFSVQGVGGAKLNIERVYPVGFQLGDRRLHHPIAFLQQHEPTLPRLLVGNDCILDTFGGWEMKRGHVTGALKVWFGASPETLFTGNELVPPFEKHARHMNPLPPDETGVFDILAEQAALDLNFKDSSHFGVEDELDSDLRSEDDPQDIESQFYGHIFRLNVSGTRQDKASTTTVVLDPNCNLNRVSTTLLEDNQIPWEKRTCSRTGSVGDVTLNINFKGNDKPFAMNFKVYDNLKSPMAMGLESLKSLNTRILTNEKTQVLWETKSYGVTFTIPSEGTERTPGAPEILLRVKERTVIPPKSHARVDLWPLDAADQALIKGLDLMIVPRNTDVRAKVAWGPTETARWVQVANLHDSYLVLQERQVIAELQTSKGLWTINETDFTLPSERIREAKPTSAMTPSNLKAGIENTDNANGYTWATHSDHGLPGEAEPPEVPVNPNSGLLSTIPQSSLAVNNSTDLIPYTSEGGGGLYPRSLNSCDQKTATGMDDVLHTTTGVLVSHEPLPTCNEYGQTETIQTVRTVYLGLISPNDSPKEYNNTVHAQQSISRNTSSMITHDELGERGLIPIAKVLGNPTSTRPTRDESVVSPARPLDWVPVESPTYPFPTDKPARPNMPDGARRAQIEAMGVRLDETEKCRTKEEVSALIECLLSEGVASVISTDGKLDFTKPRPHNVTCTLDLTSDRTFRAYPDKTTPDEKTEILRQCEQKVEQGIIEKSSAPWSSNCVCINKNGKIRVAVDYRKLNSMTVKDNYLLPTVQEVMDTLSGTKWFTTIDACQAYHQIPMRTERDKDLTTFVVPGGGLYRYRYMPFGLCNAGAVWTRFIDEVLEGLRWDVCLVYADDILIHTKSPRVEDHIRDIKAVFARLNLFDIKVKADKIRLGLKELPFLGQLVGVDGIRPDPSKTRAITDLPPPKNIHDLRRAMGMFTYYRKFIPQFATIAAPLYDYCGKNAQNKKNSKQEISLSDEALASFETLKGHLTSEPIMLQYPDWKTPFEVHCDASNVGVGATLVQKVDGLERVVMYASKSLTSEQRNYQPYEKEALALVWALELFKHYLKVTSFQVVTDCRSLLFIKNKQLNSRIGRWILRLQEFNFTIKHKAGALLKDADTLSRAPLTENEYGSAEIDPIYEQNPDAAASYQLAAEQAIAAANEPNPVFIGVVTRASAKEKCSDDKNKKKQLWESNPVATKTRKRRQPVGDDQDMTKRVSDEFESSKKEPSQKKGKPRQDFPLIDQTKFFGDSGDPGMNSNFGNTGGVESEHLRNPKFHASSVDQLSTESDDKHIQKRPHIHTQQNIIGEDRAGPQFFKCEKELEGYEIKTWITEQNNPHNKDMKFILTQMNSQSSAGPVPKSKFTFKLNIQGLIVMVSDGKKERCVVPESLRAFVMQQHHNAPLHAHQGRNRFQRMLRERYFWPGMTRDAARWIRSCVSCAKRKTPRPLAQGLTTPALSSHPFQVVGIDLVGKCPETDGGHQWILTIVDHFTRWPIAVPIPNRQACTIAHALYRHLICEHGVPQKILSDQGRELIGTALQVVYDTWGIKGVHTGGYNPQANGACERFHRWLNTTLTQLYDKKTPNWDMQIPAVLFAYRVSVNDVTGYSPYFLLHGREPLLPSDVTFTPNVTQTSLTYDEFRSNVTTLLKSAFNVTRQRQYEAHVYNYQRSRERVKPDLHPGDLVLVWKKSADESRMEIAGDKRSLPSKWQYPWAGPGRFIKEVSNTNCEVELYGKTKNYNYNRVVRFRPWDEVITSTTEPRLFPPGGNTDSLVELFSMDEPFLVKLASDTHSNHTHAVGMYRGMKGEYIDFQWMGNYGNGKPTGVFLPGWVDPKDNKEYYKAKRIHPTHHRFTGESTGTYITLTQVLMRGDKLIRESGKLTTDALSLISSFRKA